MWTIYHSASSVLSCVGPPDEASDVVHEAILDIADAIAETCVELADMVVPPEEIHDPNHLSPEKHYQRIWALGKGVGYCATLCKAYNEFCKRPYFSRLWVAQELHAGGAGLRIMFGVKRASWKLLTQLDRALAWAFSDPNMADATPPLFEGHTGPASTISRLIRATERRGMGLFEHFQWTSHLLCYDIRDYVYGTMNFIDWEHAGVPRLEPDYTVTAFELAVALGSISQRSKVNSVLHMSVNFCVVLRALNISAHDPLLVPYLLSSNASKSQLQGESHHWLLWTTYQCRLDETSEIGERRLAEYLSDDTFWPQASKNAIGSDSGRVSSRALREQCEAVLEDHDIAMGYGWPRSGAQSHPPFYVPALATAGDIILRFEYASTQVNIVVRRARKSQEVSVVGKATGLRYFRGIETKDIRMNWRHVKVVMEATVEEMISLLVPSCSLDCGIEPFAFPLPKVISLATTHEGRDVRKYSVTEKLMPSSAGDSAASEIEESESSDRSGDTDMSENTEESEGEDVAA